MVEDCPNTKEINNYLSLLPHPYFLKFEDIITNHN